MRMERLKLSLLRENDWNPNRMSERMFESLVNAIREEGFLQPLLVREVDGGYEVIDGAHRLRAAVRCGLEEVPCVVIETDEERAKLQTVMMNRLRGKMEARELATLVKEFDDEWAKRLLAYTEKELKDIVRLVEEDEPRLREEWLTRPSFKIVVEFLMSEADEKELERTLTEVSKATGCCGRTEALLHLCRFWQSHNH